MELKFRAQILTVIVLLGLLNACGKRKTPAAADLLGSWKTDTVQTEWGPAVFEVTFYNASDLEFKMIPAEKGQNIVAKGKYHLNHNGLVSEFINKGNPAAIWLENKQLVIHVKPEPPQRFNRE